MVNAKRKRNGLLGMSVLNRLIPENIEFNYITLLSRTSSLMIRQNSKLMVELTHPDILIDIQLNRYKTFDFDKSEKLIAIGRHRAKQALEKKDAT